MKDRIPKQPTTDKERHIADLEAAAAAREAAHAKNLHDAFAEIQDAAAEDRPPVIPPKANKALSDFLKSLDHQEL